MAYDWPGNVRQLRNVVESMVVVDDDGVLGLNDLPEDLRGVRSNRRRLAEPRQHGRSTSIDVEKQFIADTLNLTGVIGKKLRNPWGSVSERVSQNKRASVIGRNALPIVIIR